MTSEQKVDTLVTPQMEEEKGVWKDERVSPPVSESDIRKWAIASYWPEKPPQLFWDHEYAKGTKWGGIIAPAKVPRPVIQKLNADIVAALNEPDVRERLTQLGADVVASTPEQFDALLRSDTVRYQKLIKDAGIVPQ